MKKMRLLLVALCAILGLLATACGGSDGGDAATSSSASETSSSADEADSSADDEDAMADDEDAMADDEDDHGDDDHEHDDEEEHKDDDDHDHDDEDHDHDHDDEEGEEEDAMAATGDGDAILRVALQFGPDSGLAIETDDASILMKAGITEGLVRADASGAPVPGLAESWERIDDVTWEFSLRDGVQFHDGSPLNAAAVETALAHITSVASPPRSLGGLELTTEIVDDLTIRVITSEPDPIMPLRVSSRSMVILAPAAYESEPTAPIGTGPFALTDFTPPDSLTVERFDGYWGEIAKLDGAVFRFLPDAGSRAAAVRNDEIDVAGGIALADLDAVNDDPDVDLIRFSLPRTASLYANTASGPMSDPVVREAVSLAVDEVLLAEQLLEGQFAPAFGYFGTENPWAPQSDPDPADAVEQAAALVESVDPANRSIRIWTYASRPELPDMATVAQAQLQAVGFDVEIEVGEYTPLEERVFNNEHDLFLLSRGYYFDMADAAAVFTSDFTCEGGYNLNRYCSEEFDALVASMSEAEAAEDRHALFGQAAAILAEEFVGMPLVHDSARYAARTDVQGLEIDKFETTILTPQVSLG